MDNRHRWRKVRKTGLASLQAAFGMEIAGTTAVPASPPGPGHNQLHTAGSRPDQASQQMTHFRHRQGKQRSSLSRRITSRRGLWGKCRRSLGNILGADRGKVRMRQHDQRDMAIPPDPTADFVLVQSHLLAGFKVFLTMKACADGLHHLAERSSRRGKDEVVGLFSRIGEAPTHEQPVASILAPLDATSGRTPSQKAWDPWSPRSSRGAATPGHAARGLPLPGLPPVCVLLQA